MNVSRSKTRKWAEFKPANYDGDDWGADDDELDDTPPPPPHKHPMGPRQPSVPLPSARQFTSVGSPPTLQLQTQRIASSPTAPASANGALERTGMDHLVSPQSEIPQSAAATVSSVHSSNPPPSTEVLPVRTKSPPAPLSAGHTPTRFPPRKSSMGAHDAPILAPLAGSTPGSRSSSRPGSSHNKQFAEGRSASPANARSPLTSPAKPLPFVRPADIYRRMEEEKEKERRRSMESGGRPSLDGVRSSSRAGERPEPSALPRPQPVVQVQHKQTEQVEETQESQPSRNLRPSLATVAERKSEYGLEGLIDSYGSDDMTADPEPAAYRVAALEQPAPSALEPAQDLRRYSTSPKLPELGRMSMFGDDFFSTSSRLSSQPPPMPDTSHLLAVSTQQPAPSAKSAASVQESTDVVQADNAAVQSAQATTEIPTIPPPENEPSPSDAAPPDTETPRQQAPAAEAVRHSASSPESKQATRPTLPGGWVTETLESPGEAHLLAGPVASRTVSRKGIGSGNMSLSTKPTHDPTSDSRSEAVATISQQSTPSPTNSQVALPPLRTSSPPSNASVQTASGQIAPQAENANAASSVNKSEDVEAVASESELASPVPTIAAEHDPEIIPTAPLNPSRSAQNVGLQDQFVPPQSFETRSALDTTNSSPVKESDMLREEIIKSLSPLGPSRDYSEVTGDDTDAYYAAAGGTVRESTYLGDVYGDYWAESDDKPTVVTTIPETQSDSQRAADGSSTAAQTSVPPLPAAPEEHQTPPSSAGSEERTPGGTRRRFSWETESRAANSQIPTPVAVAEQKSTRDEAASQVPVTEPAPAAPAGPSSSPAPKPETTGLSIQTSGGISHQVSGASTLPARSTDGPIEPPSPISVLSEKNEQPDDSYKLSIPEDKVLVQPPTIPLSMFTVPSEAIAEPADSYASPSQATPPPAEPSSPTTNKLLSIMTFRQIMDLPVPSERVRSFKETRSQFAAIDTGLNDWMSAMASHHPEHANTSSSFRAGLVGSGGIESQQVGQAPSQVNVHASIFHQHNASTAAFGHTARPAPNIPMPPTPPHGSPLGHSGAQVAQVGAKSKKLLMAAGKAGKGLLSKGKNKLSGTGDKVFF